LYYGTAVSQAVGGSTDASGYLVMGGAGFLVPYLLTKNASVPEGASTLAIGGMFQGAIHGWLLGGLLYGNDLSARTGWGLSATIGVAETVGGFMIAKHSGLTAGEASLMNTSMFYGTVFGALGGGNFITESTTASSDIRLITGLGLAGAVAGVVTANAIRHGTRVNVADASVFSVTTFVTSVLPLAVLPVVTDSYDGTLFSALTMASIAGGMAMGTLLIDGVDYPEGSALYYPLGAVAGGAIGLGIASMLSMNNRGIPLVTTLGAALGFVLVLTSEDIVAEARRFGALEFDVNPMGVLLASQANVPVPVARMQLRF
jgi:hypothetical protein